VNEPLSLTRVAVTGASGFVGRALVARLISAGVDVVGVARKPAFDLPQVGQWIVGDLRDPDTAMGLLEAQQLDAIFHLAANVTGTREAGAVLPIYHDVLTATVNLLAATAVSGSDPAIVVAGSLEDTLGESAFPGSPYAAAKEGVRRYAAMFHGLYETRVTYARLFMVYGPGDRHDTRLIPSIIRSLEAGVPPRLSSGRRPVDWVFIDDAVDGLLALAHCEESRGRAVDIGTGRTHTVREVAERLRSVLDSSVPLDFGALPDRLNEAVQVARAVETRDLTGWRARVDLDEGLRLTVRWHSEQRSVRAR
jgi:nucleoside-diphosphate-sugar epimerase